MADADADGGDLPIHDPCAGEALAPARGYTKGGADADEQVFQRTQVPVQVLTVMAEIEDGVADKLARAMVSGLAAAISLDERMGKMRSPPKAGLVRSAANGVNGIVLEEEELIRDRPGPALRDQAVLEGEALLGIDAAQPLDGEGGLHFSGAEIWAQYDLWGL